MKPNQLPHQYNDGGRSLAGYSGKTGDCVVRALTLSTNSSYMNMYSYCNQTLKEIEKGQKSKSTSASGVYNSTLTKLMKRFKFKWVANRNKYKVNIPNRGTYIVAFTHHVSVVKDGTILDTYNPFNEVGNFVKGYWKVA